MVSRRQFLGKSLAAVATLALASSVSLPVTGCTALAKISQSTLADLVKEAGVGVVGLLNFMNDAAAAQQAQSLFNTAVAEITSWTPGTVATNVINAINDAVAFISDLNIPGLSQYMALIQFAVGVADYVITLLTQNSPAPVAGALRARRAPTVTLNNPPKKASQVRSQWNAKARALNLPSSVLLQ